MNPVLARVYGSVEPFGQGGTFAMYKMEINVSAQQRIFLFSWTGLPQGDARMVARPSPSRQSR
jgi:hypothetical protein